MYNSNIKSDIVLKFEYFKYCGVTYTYFNKLKSLLD